MRLAGKHRLELAAVAAFVLVQFFAPLVVGEVYPFTISPMFSDCPSCYALYEITDDAGNPLDAKRLGLHLVYDGNPPGFGVGVCPSPTFHAFGEVADREKITQHIRLQMKTDEKFPHRLRVRQIVVTGGGEQLKTDEQEWIVESE